MCNALYSAYFLCRKVLGLRGLASVILFKLSAQARRRRACAISDAKHPKYAKAYSVHQLIYSFMFLSLFLGLWPIFGPTLSRELNVVETCGLKHFVALVFYLCTYIFDCERSRAKRGELAERTSLRESERAPVQCMGFRTRGTKCLNCMYLRHLVLEIMWVRKSATNIARQKQT